MSPLIQSQRSLLAPAWAGYPNELWRRAKAIPSLDLRFAENKSLVDATTGQNLITFTRASSGTYVDSQGVIRTATTNLLLRSEEFNDSVWGKVGGSVTADAITAPNGQTTADLFTENTVLTQHDVRVTSPTLTDGVTYTLTVYSKTNGRRLNIIYPLDTAGHGATFDLVNGTFTYTGNTVTATIQPVGDGWYRCSCTATKSGGSGTAQLRFLTHNGTTNNYTGDGTSGIYLWGAQLEQSNTVGEYIPTTSTINSAPRFDHNPTTGESLGLLVEEQRTNLLLQSNGFDTTWTNSNSSETAAAGTAPDGTNTAWELKDTLDTVATAHALAQTASFTSGTSYTLSCWIKAGTLNEAGFTFPSSAFTTAINCRVNLTTGAVLFSSAAVTTATTLFANGWVRVVATATATATATSATLNIRPMNGAASYIGTGTGTILIWGAQLEAGSFPTSYIPTTTATATRSADVASITGSGYNSWANNSAGSIFASYVPNTPASGTSRRIFSISDGTTTNAVVIGYGPGSTADAFINPSLATITTVNQSAIPSAAALAYSASSLDYSYNGQSPLSSAVGGPLGSYTSAYIGIGENGVDTAVRMLNGWIRRLTYWPQRLPNSTLQQITQ